MDGWGANRRIVILLGSLMLATGVAEPRGADRDQEGVGRDPLQPRRGGAECGCGDVNALG